MLPPRGALSIERGNILNAPSPAERSGGGAGGGGDVAASAAIEGAIWNGTYVNPPPALQGQKTFRRRHDNE